MAAFEYRQALEVRDTFQRHGVRYLFIGKSGAILLGYPDTTQDADLFLDKDPDNGRAAVTALRDLGFPLTDLQAAEIERGKDFVQIREGPFDLDLVFAPDGIERFEVAWARTIGSALDTSTHRAPRRETRAARVRRSFLQRRELHARLDRSSVLRPGFSVPALHLRLRPGRPWPPTHAGPSRFP